jgi:hypothetical protein
MVGGEEKHLSGMGHALAGSRDGGLVAPRWFGCVWTLGD